MPLLYLENPAGGSRGPLAHDGEVLMLPIRVHAREPPTPPTDDPIIPSPSPPLIRSPASLRTVTRLVPSHQRPIRIQANRRTAIRALTPLPTASRMFLLLATRRLPPSQWPWAGGGPSVIDPVPPTRRVRGMLRATPTACRAAWCRAGSRRPFAVPPRPNRWCRPYPPRHQHFRLCCGRRLSYGFRTNGVNAGPEERDGGGN